MDKYETFLKQKVDNLALDSRAYNMLKKANINNIEDLIRAKEKGLEQIDGLGKKSISTIEKALEFLKIKFGLSDKSDTRPYAHPLYIINNDKPNILKILVNITEYIINEEQDKRSLEIINRRHGFKGNKYYTLKDLGKFYDLTKERIRQIEEKCLKLIGNTILGNNRSLDWKIHPKIISESVEVYNKLIDLDELLTEKEIKSFFNDRYRIDCERYLDEMRYLLKLFGFEKIASSNFSLCIEVYDCWKIEKELDISILNRALKFVQEYLKKQVVPVALFDLKIELNKDRETNIGYNYLEHALKICKEIKKKDQNHFVIKFKYLQSIGQKAYRVLNDVGQSMHYRDILKEINSRLANSGISDFISEESLRSALANYEKLLPIGKGGKWFIKDWRNYSNITIEESIEEYFHKKGKKATIEDIYDYVKEKRPGVPQSSVLSILKLRKEKFMRISETEYILKVWGGEEYKDGGFKRNEYTREDFYKTTEKFYNKNNINKTTQKSLFKYLRSKISLNRSTFYRWVKKSPFLEKEKNNNSRSDILKFVEVDDDILIPFYNTGKGSKSRRVKESIEQFLNKQPDKREKIRVVRDHILDQGMCTKHSFYNYLEEMDNVEKEKINNEAYCFLIIEKEEINSIISGFSDIINDISDPSLKKELNKTLNKFNLEEIDMAMFKLGKIFENVIKDFLNTADKKNVFEVSNNDMRTLARMIQCIVDNGIIRKSHHLTLLREIRNERAHEIPEEKERKKLLQHAPFIGELYLKYISKLHNKKNEILSI